MRVGGTSPPIRLGDTSNPGDRTHPCHPAPYWLGLFFHVPSTIPTVTDADYMDQALREAEDAFARGDWPVGSILVRDGVVLATGQNRQTTERDVTWRAEFEALRRASTVWRAWLEPRCTPPWSRVRCARAP
jgi:hypothetical protein